jgi:8-oxo-dGTP pyrophosphatase MutT (NUDIX family)
MSYRLEKRHKAIVIPVLQTDTGDPKFLTVRDSRHQEWIFVTGGCKKSEVDNPLKCGLRELEEETRGTFVLRNGEFSEFQFESTYRSPEETKKDRFEGVIVTLVYHVYLINVRITEEQQARIIQEFHINKARMEMNKKDGVRIKKAYDENDDISFDTLSEFNKKNRWNLIIKNIIENPKFYDLIHSSKTQNFNIRTL